MNGKLRRIKELIKLNKLNFIIGQLSSIFNWAIKNEIINKNPCINCIYRRTWSPKSETLGQFM